MFYTDMTETLLSGLDGRCPGSSSIQETELAEELESLIEANADWEIILRSDIEGNRKDDIRADRAAMQKNRLRIREIRKILSEQKEETMNMEGAIA